MTTHRIISPVLLLFCLMSVAARAADKADPPKPQSHTVRNIVGWTVRVDDRLLQPPNKQLAEAVLKVLEARLFDINVVVPPDRLEKLHAVTIVLDLSHGKLEAMQYHPDVDWLLENGYDRELVHCVHIPVAAALLEPRQINVQPWCVLHELAHAYHDQVLGFDEVRIRDACTHYKQSGHGNSTLLITGGRVRHYALTDHKEFFAEMSESYFGTNDFFPFNRAELMEAEPEICRLMESIWGPVETEQSKAKRNATRLPGGPSSAASEKTRLGPEHPSAATVLWYGRPAEKWDEALPVGNGRLGAMVFGGSEHERLALNEQTIWTGGPYDPSRSGGPEALPEIRRLVFAGKYVEAEELFGRTMLGKPVEQMKYQPLGNLSLEFPGHAAATDYRRQLDLDTAVAAVSYRVGGVGFHREAFVTPVDQVIVVRLSADKPGSVSLKARVDGVRNTKTPGDESHAVEIVDASQLLLRGKTGSMLGIEGRVRYEARVRVLAEGGKLIADKDGVRIDGADAATLLIAAATNFTRYDNLGGDPAVRVRQYLEKVNGSDYNRLRAAHVVEHQRLFRRVRLSLPQSEASLRPTDVRIRNYDPRKDPQLAALLFQYGRYLLICSSRPGCQPANLQGIWNEDMDPAWDAKFTTNINLEMNYWPAEVAALPECVEPLTEMVKELAETGARVAKKHYGAGGWVFHQNTDQWRAAAPMDGSTWGTFSVGGAWLCTHLWEHYRYTGDKEYLRKVYPLLKGCAQFFLDTLVDYPGPAGKVSDLSLSRLTVDAADRKTDARWLVTCPSTSPENFPARPGNKPFHDRVINFDLPGTTISAGSTIDLCILRDLFRACAEAGKVLNVDRDFCSRVTAARLRLAPLQIGKRGNLQEWIEDWGDLEDQHRHISHLYSLYPSNQISPDTEPKLAAAAKVSLDERGDHGTGFGMAWKAACWARLRDGDRADRCLANLVSLQTCPNLFSKCFRAPQVDGSFGATAAVAEILLQSQHGTIHLLPALPKGWGEGEFIGLRARGGFTVDAAWKNGLLMSATVYSTLGGRCVVRAACPIVAKGITSEAVQAPPGEHAIRFDTARGGTYTIRPQDQRRKADS